MTLKHALLATSAATVMSFGLADMAAAQNLAIEEIVVSARKREESLQEVPLAISAFSSENLKDLDIRGVYELQNFTPNFSFDKSFGRRFDRPIIRGQSSVQASDVLASFFVDGVYISGSITTVSTDALERIEVLRGPQSALYGRGAFGGAINYVTKQPSDEFEGQVNTRVGSHDDYKGAIWARGPIVEGKLQYFLSGNWEYYGGQWRNQYQGRTTGSVGPVNNFVNVPDTPDNSRLGKEEVRDTTAKLRFLPTESLEFNVKASYAKSYDTQFAAATIPASMHNCFRPGIDAGTPTYRPGITPLTPAPNLGRGYFCGEVEVRGLVPRLNLAPLRQGVIMNAVNTTPTITVPAPAGSGLQPTVAPNPAFGQLLLVGGQPITIAGAPARPGQYRTVGIYVADAQWNFNDWNTIAQVTYNTDKAEYNLDADRTSLLNPTSNTVAVVETSGGSQSYEINYDYSFEFRATSPQQERLRGIVGAYYYDREAKSRGRTLGGAVVTGARFNADGSDFSRSFITYKAVFGSAEYDITDQLTIGAEARYGQDQRSIPSNPATTRPVESKIKNFTPRVSLDYKVDDDVMVYASFAKGVLPGGFNAGAFSRSATAGPTDAEFARLQSEGKATFDAEENLVYELGVKSTLMDGRLVMNGDVFYIDWSKQKINNNERINTPSGVPSSINIQTNSGSSRVQGIEFSTSFLATEQLTLSAGYGMADHVFKKANDVQIEGFTGVLQDFTLANGGNAKGKHSILAPKHTATASAAYKDDLSADARWFVRADFSYRTKLWTEVHNVSHTGDRWGVNSRLGVETDDWQVDLYVNNVLNDLTPSAVFRGANSSVVRYAGNPFQAVTGLELSLPRGREFGITGQYNF
ncbi:MAG: TonB-dependent receptor [Rhodospirillaceae bacterium]|nr:TonB-dependent receptor [Rhodospirillaceae bacterium]